VWKEKEKIQDKEAQAEEEKKEDATQEKVNSTGLRLDSMDSRNI
jgi:hypothetical protein